MTAKPDELADFPVVIELPVQWGDQDAFGHVNNVVYFRWFESARIEYWRRFGLDRTDPASPLGPILAAVSCDYRRQLTWPDSVLIGARITRLGRSSVTMAHRVYSTALQAVAADAQSTVVLFDYSQHKSQRLPDELRRAIEALEGGDLLQNS